MDELARHIPEHLTASSWLTFEERCVMDVVEELKSALDKKNLKLSGKNVHAIRVVIRRFNSVWTTLQRDGWRGRTYDPFIGKPLARINGSLGKLRDLDVQHGLARSMGLPESYCKWLKGRRKKIELKVAQKLTLDRPRKVVRKLRKYLRERAVKLRLRPDNAQDHLNQSRSLSPARSHYLHMDDFLIEIESKAKTKALAAGSAAELHELRLLIKQWRYMLTEFMGVTNLELVQAQSILGKHHDLSHLAQEMDLYLAKKEAAKDATKKLAANDKRDFLEAKGKIAAELKKLEKELEPLLFNLPYGLRPYMATRIF